MHKPFALYSFNKMISYVFLLLFFTACSTSSQSSGERTQTSIENGANSMTQPIQLQSITATSPMVNAKNIYEGCLVYSVERFTFETESTDVEISPIYSLCENFGRNQIIPLGLEGILEFVAASPDKTHILITRADNTMSTIAQLYLIDLSHNDLPSRFISEVPRIPFAKLPVAQWMNDYEFSYVADSESSPGVYIYQLADGQSRLVVANNTQSQENQPSGLLFAGVNRIVWFSLHGEPLPGCSTCVSTICTSYVTDMISLKTEPFKVGNDQMIFNINNLPIISPDDAYLTWIEPATPESGPPYHNHLHFVRIADGNILKTVETLTSNLEVKWFPCNTEVLVLDRTAVFSAPKTYKSNNLYGLYILNVTNDAEISNLTHTSSHISDLLENDKMGGYSLSMISVDAGRVILQKYDFDPNMEITVKSYAIDLNTLEYFELEDLDLIGSSAWF